MLKIIVRGNFLQKLSRFRSFNEGKFAHDDFARGNVLYQFLKRHAGLD